MKLFKNVSQCLQTNHGKPNASAFFDSVHSGTQFKKELHLVFLADPPLPVPSLEYPSDIHFSGTIGHFQLST
jgi:hypothetical protein